MKSGVAEVRVVHHKDLNKKILIALIVASTLLGGILLLLSCFWIYRHKSFKTFNTKKQQSFGIFFTLINLFTYVFLKTFLFHHVISFFLSFEDAPEGLSLGPILDKFNSLRTSSKKGVVAVLEYPLLVDATNNFDEVNILGDGGFGCVYKAQFNDNFIAAVKRLHGGGQDAEREFEVIFEYFNFPCWILFSLRLWVPS